MAESNFKIPKFGSESEEAEWCASHPDLIADEFERAAAEGRHKKGSAAQDAQESSNPDEASIRLNSADALRAHEFASKRGVSYESYSPR